MLYVIKLNIILALLCLLFQVVMHRDTFFGVRRAMLWGIYLTAFLLPLWNVQYWLQEDAAAMNVASDYATYVLPSLEVTATRVAAMGIQQEEPGCGMWFVGVLAIWGLLYLIPVVWMTLKLLWQFAYIIYLRCTCNAQPSPLLDGRGRGWVFYRFPRPCSPFSFGPWIFLHAEGMDEQTLREVLIHEQAHVRGWHTLDILFSQLVCILFWWNPAAWVLRREVRMNLEFIADKAVCDVLVKSERVKSEKYKFPASHETVVSDSNFSLGGKADIFHFSLIRAYQYRLLGFATQTNVATIANNFNVLPLKRRIKMMNLRRTRRTGMVKYILFVPVAAAMLLLSNIDSLARTIADNVKKPIELVDDNASSQYRTYSLDLTKGPYSSANLKKWEGKSLTALIVDGKPVTEVTPLTGQWLESIDISNVTITEDAEGNITQMELRTKKVAANADEPAVKTVVQSLYEADDNIYENVEQMPEYSGGEAALYQFIAQNIRYPKAAQEWGVQGRVFVHFIVEKDGTLSNVSASKVVDPKSGKELAEVTVTYKIQAQTPEQVEAAKHRAEGVKALKAETERVVKALPERWKPGRQHGQPVRVSFHLPVSYRLQ